MLDGKRAYICSPLSATTKERLDFQSNGKGGKYAGKSSIFFNGKRRDRV